MNPKFPIFIPSKGRSDTLLTVGMFNRLGVPYTVFVEKPEYDLYAERIEPDKIHILPHKDKGLTATRNYIWDFAAANNHEYFWTFDDNIDGLYRFNHNLKTPCADATILAVIEDFAQRYENLAICGCNYFMFVKRKYVIPPYILNTRIYSNMLIKTFAKDRNGRYFRNVTFFNDDTDLCLRVLKNSYCTVLFNAFLIYKQPTMTTEGGMTDLYRATNNRLEFAEELQRAHPDIVRVTEKWGRYHHHVDYSGFTQQLRRKAGIEIPRGINNFGMVLQERKNKIWCSSEVAGGSKRAAVARPPACTGLIL